METSMTYTIQSNAVVMVFLFFIFMRFLLKIVTYPFHDLLDELQHLDGSLAVGGHHHVAVCLPTNCTDKLVDVLVLSIPIKKRPDCVELKLEQMFT